jgi:hypothetical protein
MKIYIVIFKILGKYRIENPAYKLTLLENITIFLLYLVHLENIP